LDKRSLGRSSYIAGSDGVKQTERSESTVRRGRVKQGAERGCAKKRGELDKPLNPNNLNP
jgi:hypothetical protein